MRKTLTKNGEPQKYNRGTYKKKKKKKKRKKKRKKKKKKEEDEEEEEEEDEEEEEEKKKKKKNHQQQQHSHLQLPRSRGPGDVRSRSSDVVPVQRLLQHVVQRGVERSALACRHA